MYNEIMKCASAFFFFFQDRPLGCNIFRHNKAIAGGVQSLVKLPSFLHLSMCNRLSQGLENTRWAGMQASASLQTMSISPQRDASDGCAQA